MDAGLFKKRRNAFFRRMKDGVAVFKTMAVARRNGDVDHPFRQDSDFFYLTGFEEPNAYAVFEKDGNERRFTMFVEPNDPETEVWTGRKNGPEGARDVFGADEAYPVAEFFERLPSILTNKHRVYMEFGRDPGFDRRVMDVIEDLKAQARKGVFGPWEVLDPRTITWRLRLVKQKHDLVALQKACDITARSFMAVMRAVEPGMNERELAAALEFEFARRGADRLGFDTICASGVNATTLHYVSNDSVIGRDDMVLLDAGAEVDYVSADVTRTFPASGRFSEPGLSVYRWVLKAQEAAIAAVRPGVAYSDVHTAALEVLCKGLKKLGVLDGSVKRIIEEQSYMPFFMHRIGHWLGMDVHDVGPYFDDAGESLELREGMVLTVEPGLYFADADTSPPELRGIGVRIEDDVLVTKDGCTVLTRAIPKQPAQIEEWMGGGSWWRDLAPVTVSAPRT